MIITAIERWGADPKCLSWHEVDLAIDDFSLETLIDHMAQIEARGLIIINFTFHSDELDRDMPPAIWRSTLGNAYPWSIVDRCALKSHPWRLFCGGSLLGVRISASHIDQTKGGEL